MSEYFIAVNVSRNEYVDPNNFSNTIDATAPAFHHATAITHIDWCIGRSTWILPYLLANSKNEIMWEETYGSYFGSWSGDHVVLLGDTTNLYSTVIDEWNDISKPVFYQVTQSDTDILHNTRA